MSIAISEGYKKVNGEYVKETILIQAREIERYVEKTIVDFFSKLGYNITRIKEGQDRNVDYKYEDIGFEVTIIHEYLPRISEIDALISQHNKTDSKVCAYMYGENGKVKIKKIQETPMDKQSVLSIRQHISSYRPKLVNKLDDKNAQSEHSKYVIIVMDFRLARFDSLSMKREVSAILKENGASYSTLIGVLILSPEKKDSELYGKSKYVFVPNTHCVLTSPLIESLKKYRITSADEWWTVNHVFIKTEHGKSVPIQYLQCLESKQELEKLGLPTFDL